ncbi:hypothetical protein BQ8794_50731 [Mesorhizobium prunaredense]|uniref:Uncharacterized protein n=1 Tax=Mesorhizobium prunaredense TaxID=1631249 RepID=A0A1R3VFE5_9HYPH|nr:hypothetical protein [Mesorhizobium prunaredense]SIT58629.1 hypothetical protein BQ8794_50731 [Mesorhizobium prunaredense]
MNQHIAQKTIEAGAVDLAARLAELRTEWAEGQRRLDMLDAERAKTRDTLLRIGGAIQVLEELSGSGDPNDAGTH